MSEGTLTTSLVATSQATFINRSGTARLLRGILLAGFLGVVGACPATAQTQTECTQFFNSINCTTKKSPPSTEEFLKDLGNAITAMQQRRAMRAQAQLEAQEEQQRQAEAVEQRAVEERAIEGQRRALKAAEAQAREQRRLNETENVRLGLASTVASRAKALKVRVESAASRVAPPDSGRAAYETVLSNSREFLVMVDEHIRTLDYINANAKLDAVEMWAVMIEGYAQAWPKKTAPKRARKPPVKASPSTVA